MLDARKAFVRKPFLTQKLQKIVGASRRRFGFRWRVKGYRVAFEVVPCETPREVTQRIHHPRDIAHVHHRTRVHVRVGPRLDPQPHGGIFRRVAEGARQRERLHGWHRGRDSEGIREGAQVED